MPAFGPEKRVISESAFALRLCEDFSFDSTGKEMSIGTDNQCDCTPEPCMTVGLVLKLGQETGVIRGIVAMPAGIAGTEDTRCAAERIDFETGIVGKTVIPIAFLHPSRFLESILLERGAGLGDIVMTSYIGKRKNGKTPAENLSDLGELMTVVGCEYYAVH